MTGPFRRRLGFLRLMLPLSLALAVLLALIGLVVDGPTAAVALAAGTGIVAVSFAFSSFMLVWAELINPKLVLPVGLGLYAMKFTVLFLAFTLVARSGWAGLRPLAFGVLIATLVWITAQAWWVWRDKPRMTY